MAKRVQVERVRTPTAINPVASPVDVFVRPAQKEEPKSDLLTAVKALTPAVETMAEKQAKEEAKRKAEAEAAQRAYEREVQQKIKQRKALEGKLAFEQGVADWERKVDDNKLTWLEEGEDAFGQRMQEHFTGVISGIADPDVREAIDFDYRSYGIKSLSSYSKARDDHYTNKSIEQTFTNLINSGLTGEEFVNKLNEDLTLLNQTYDVPFKQLNDTLADIALQRTELDDPRFYDALKALKQDTVGDPKRQQVVSQIEAVLKRKQSEADRLAAAAAKEAAKAFDAEAEIKFGDSMLDAVVENGGLDVIGQAGFAGWTNAAGELEQMTFSQKKELVTKAAEQRDDADAVKVANGQMTAEEALKRSTMRWESLGVKNPQWEAEMRGGLTTISNINVQSLPADDAEFMAALPASFRKGYERYKILKANNPALLATNTDDQTRVMYTAIDSLTTVYGEQGAIRRVIDLANNGSEVTAEQRSVRYQNVADQVKSLSFDDRSFNFGDETPVNRGYLTRRVERLTRAYIALDMTGEAALAKAVEDVSNTTMSIRGIAVPKIEGMPQDINDIAASLIEDRVKELGEDFPYEADDLSIAPVGNQMENWTLVLRSDGSPVPFGSVRFDQYLSQYREKQKKDAMDSANKAISSRGGDPLDRAKRANTTAEFLFPNY